MSTSLAALVALACGNPLQCGSPMTAGQCATQTATPGLLCLSLPVWLVATGPALLLCDTGQLRNALWKDEAARYDRYERPSVAVAVARGEQWRRAAADNVSMQLQLLQIKERTFLMYTHTARTHLIQDIDTKKQVLTVDVFVRTMWFDQRLRFNRTCVNDRVGESDAPFRDWKPHVPELGFDSQTMNEIWAPRIVFSNLAVPEKILEPENNFWLSEEGLVWYACL